MSSYLFLYLSILYCARLLRVSMSVSTLNPRQSISLRTLPDCDDCCRIEDMFEWILEVDEDALGEDRGRIQIIVEYEMNLPSPSSSPRQQQHQQSASRRGRRHRQRSTSSSKDSTLSQSSAYRSVENRITAHVDIQRDNTYAIVPVVKVCLSVKLDHILS